MATTYVVRGKAVPNSEFWEQISTVSTSPQMTRGLHLLDDVTNETEIKLLKSDTERYISLKGDRQQHTAIYIQQLPNWTNKFYSTSDEDKVVFRCYLLYRFLQGTLGDQAAAIIEDRINSMLDFQ